MKYRDTWDLTTVPEGALFSEYHRRIGLRQDRSGVVGRKRACGHPQSKPNRKCPNCIAVAKRIERLEAARREAMGRPTGQPAS